MNFPQIIMIIDMVTVIRSVTISHMYFAESLMTEATIEEARAVKRNMQTMPGSAGSAASLRQSAASPWLPLIRFGLFLLQ